MSIEKENKDIKEKTIRGKGHIQKNMIFSPYRPMYFFIEGKNTCEAIRGEKSMVCFFGTLILFS